MLLTGYSGLTSEFWMDQGTYIRF